MAKKKKNDEMPELIIRIRPDTKERRGLIELLREQTTMDMDWGDIMSGWRPGRSRGSERAIALMVHATKIITQGDHHRVNDGAAVKPTNKPADQTGFG